MPDRKKEYTDTIRSILSAMADKTTHEDLYRIMDSISDDALPSLLNLVRKIDKLNRRIYGLTAKIDNLQRKTDRYYYK